MEGEIKGQQMEEPKKEIKIKYFTDKIADFIKNPFNIGFIITFIVAVLLRLKYLLVESIWTDESVYMWESFLIKQNPLHFFDLIFNQASRTSVYVPQAVAASFNIFFSPFTAGRVMSFAFAVSGIFLVYLTGKELKNNAVGLGAAIFLTFNHLHWFLTGRALADVALATMFTLTIYALVKYEKLKTKTWLVVLVFSAILTIFTKMAGVVILPVIVLYYITIFLLDFSKQKLFNLLKSKKTYLILLGIIILFYPFYQTALSILLNLRFEATYFKILPVIVGWYVLILSIIGFALVLFYKYKEGIAVSLWIIIFLVMISVVSAAADPGRYSLPVIPALYLLASLALIEIADYAKFFFKFKYFYWVVILVVLLIALPYYQTGDSLNKNRGMTYTGYKEAGRWIRNNIAKHEIIYVGSQGPVRLFSGYEYLDFGGPLRPSFSLTEENLTALANTTDTIFLHVDLWEYGQPAWIYPLTPEKLQKLLNLGFVPVEIISKPIMIQQGIQNVQVQFIFRKN